MRRNTRIAVTVGLIVLALVAAVAIFHDAAVAAVVRSVAGGMGYNVAFDRLNVGLSAAVAENLTVTNRAGEPVLSADRLELQYVLRDLLPGGKHRFGLSAADVERPLITLIHHPDGTYNITLPSGGGSAKPDTTPIDVRVRVRDGSVALIDRFIVPGQERRERMVGIAVDAALSPTEHSFYNVRFDLDDGTSLHPVIGKATFATQRGYEAQRWTAANLPIGPLVDFALSSHAIDVVDGSLNGLDARIYTFVDPDGTTHTHTAVRAQLERGKVYIAGIVKPLRDASGPVLVYDNGLTTTGINASIAGVPLHLAGGVYGLAAPKLRFALSGAGSLEQLQQAINAAQRQPIAGPLAFAVRAQGDLSNPIITGTFSSPGLVYRTFPLDRPNGTFMLRGRELDLLDAQLAYGPVNLEAHGAVSLEKAVHTNLVVAVSADGDRLPYVPQVLHGLQLASVVHLDGTGAQLGGSGIMYGNASNGRLDGLFSIDAKGNGVVGPVSIERNDGAVLYARVALDRNHNNASGIVDAEHFSLLPGHMPALPGLRVAALPTVAGTLDAQIAGAVDRGSLSAASGHVRLSGLRYGAITGDAVADVGAGANGALGGNIRVRSTIGTIDGDAASSGGAVAFSGRLQSSFDQLRGLTGNLNAHGGIDAQLRAISSNGTIAAQLPDLQFHDASVRGIPLRDGAATVTVNDGAIAIRALRLGVAGGTVTAQGRLDHDNEIVATTSRLDMRTLAGAGLPLTAGTLMANVRVRGTTSAPRANIALLVDNATYRNVPLSANAFAHYERNRLHINDATALALHSYATASGDIGNLGGRGTPTLDLTAYLRGAQIAPLAKALRAPLKYPDGEVDADVHVTGAANAPAVVADVRIPRGSLNGLAFRDAHVAVSGGLARIAARNGTVTVGTTSVAFSGDGDRSTQHVTLDAPHVDLADFNDYFDAADTLGGTGSAKLAATHSPTQLSANAAVSIDDARYRRFPIGNVRGSLTTQGHTIATALTVAGQHGSARIAGNIIIPSPDLLHDRNRTTIALTGSIAGLDLAQWLPYAGIKAPVVGIVDGTAHVNGSLAAPTFDASAALTNGVVQKYPITALTVALNGNLHSAHLTALHVAGPGMTADANGTLGYGAHDPVAIALHAQSDDIGLLAKSLGTPLDIGGAVTTTINASGTRSAPQLAQTIDATKIRSGTYTIAHAHADLNANPQTVQLRSFDADLAQGRITATATLPIQLSPAPGVRNAPFTATLRAEQIGLAQFSAVAGANARLNGMIDGEITAGGTIANPVLGGTIALVNGSYASNLVPSTFDKMRAKLTLAQSSAQLTDVHANVGGGSIDGSGSATFGDLRNLQQTLAANGKLNFSNASLNVANFIKGTVNGALTADKTQTGIPQLGGDLTISSTRLSYAALIPHGKANPSAPAPPALAFALNVTAGNDVRVQGPGVDIGARGTINVGGTLAKPELRGRLTSTDGQLSFYRTFVLQKGEVAFDPADGIIPNVDATATTHITSPDTDVLLHVTGPATQLNLDLSSSPTYDKSQILGLLVNAQALGAVSGVAQTQGSGTGFNATNVAGSFLGQQFTQNLLQPLGSQLGQSLGFENLALGYDFGNGFSAGARRQLGKHFYTTINQTFGANQRQSIALNYDLPKNSSAALTFFSAGNETSRSILSDTHAFFGGGIFEPTNYTLEALQPPPGISGLVLTYQRKYP